MTARARTTIEQARPPALEAIATAASARLRAHADGDKHDDAELHQRVADAASAAIAAGLPLAAIADAEQVGHARARDELRGDVLRRIERAARRKHEVEAEYAQAVIRGVRLGLADRELATAAMVAHRTVRAIAARTQTADQTPARATTSDELNGGRRDPAPAGEQRSGASDRSTAPAVQS
ncbi:MAG: hypothetical protein ABSG43_17010 [Solirubrobacteraceae bacterium]|jgi:hypothetical protein